MGTSSKQRAAKAAREAQNRLRAEAEQDHTHILYLSLEDMDYNDAQMRRGKPRRVETSGCMICDMPPHYEMVYER